MFNKLIPVHLKKIESLNSENIILVYKGFPVNFLFELSNSYPFLNDKNILFLENKIFLESTQKNIGQLISKILNKDKGINILTYEEFVLVAQKLPDLSLFKGKFIIFENDLFEEYPNQSTERYIDIEQSIENNILDLKENKLFFEFYSDSSMYKNENLIKYKEIELDEFKNIEIHSFFQNEATSIDLKYQEIEPDELLDKDTVIFPISDSYIELELQMFSGEKVKNLQLIINNSAILTKNNYREELNRLKILNYIFEINKIGISISIKKNILKTSFRNEFLDILKKYWKSEEFRELVFYKHPELNEEKEMVSQGSVIEEIVRQSEKANSNVRNNFNDIFLTAPTGSGKSVLFQVPAIYLAQKYNTVTIVVSPLKSLMYDQVESLKSRGINFATFINSDISLLERERIIEDIQVGKISILYLSPELLLSYDLKHFIGSRHVGLLVIDEAHLVTTWGRDFRVDYWFLGNYIRKLHKYSDYGFPVFALTATAVYMGRNDIVFQTIESLNMQTPKFYIGNAIRENIKFEISEFNYKGNHTLSKNSKTKDLIQENIDNKTKTIIYFPWINQISAVLNEVEGKYREKIGEYYGNLDKTRKQIVIDKFHSGEILIILATKAFGMGVDIEDIEMIYHYAPSGSLLDYIQEIGRVARNENMVGKAKTDFCEKDLKYTKILHGLSSIKQYQVQFALKKIWDIYSHKKEQNFLTSVDDFAFIFSDKTQDMETKVKSTLLLLEKDLIKKYKYNVIIMRPKSLFSEVFACIPKNIEEDFLKKYNSYCSKISTIEDNYRKGYGKNTVNVHDIGNIFKIELNKMWERFFKEDSFPVVKRKFFNKELFCDFKNSIIPRYKLTINLNQSKSDTIKKIDEYFQKLDNTFKKIQGNYFTKKRLLSLLKEDFEDEILRRRVTDLIINLYTSPNEWGETGRNLKTDTFLQTKSNEFGDLSFRVINSAYIKIKYLVIKKFNSMITDRDNLNYCRYISINDKESEFRIKISYLLESFNLGNYEIIGGESPQLFIRINDPYKLKQLVMKNKYTNEILQNIENRYKNSVETMNHFFSSNMEDNERWDYVEKYFLGKANNIEEENAKL